MVIFNTPLPEGYSRSFCTFFLMLTGKR